MNLPAGPRNYLIELRGDLLHGRLVGSIEDAGWAACDLIGAGIDTPSTLELAGHALSIGSLAEIEALIHQVLSDCGLPPIDIQQEPWKVVLDVSLAIQDGTLPISAGADFLIAELSQRCGYPTEIMQFMLLIDDWEVIRATPPTDDDLRQQAGKIAEAAQIHNAKLRS